MKLMAKCGKLGTPSASFLEGISWKETSTNTTRGVRNKSNRYRINTKQIDLRSEMLKGATIWHLWCAGCGMTFSSDEMNVFLI